MLYNVDIHLLKYKYKLRLLFTPLYVTSPPTTKVLYVEGMH